MTAGKLDVSLRFNEHAAWRFGAAMRRAGRGLSGSMWRLFHKPISDRERYALRLARRHIAEGRPDLAAEDLAWLAGGAS